jgi:LacI family transcriptional regulator
MPEKIATIADIARLAGVSPATVSRTLNKSGYVGEKNRRLVEDIIKTTGFVPNAAAKTIVTGQTKLLGLIIPTFENPVYHEILKGANEAAVERGFSVVLCIEGEDDQSVNAAMLRLAALQVDGIIIARPEYHAFNAEEKLKPFLARRLPIVQLGTQSEENRIDGIIVNDYECGYAVGVHLARLGHEYCTILGEPVNKFVQERHNGFRNAFLDQGLRTSDLIVESADFSRSGGISATLRALSARPDTSAIFAMNDIMAVGALEAAEQSGCMVPEDLAIVGFDGIQLGSLVRPRLTTIIIPTFEIGKTLVELLLSRIDGTWTGESRQVVLNGRLKVRESSVAGSGRLA